MPRILGPLLALTFAASPAFAHYGMIIPSDPMIG
jgi:hypothetical protein